MVAVACLLIFGPSHYHALTHPLDIITRTTYLATFAWLPESAKAVPNIKLIQFFSAGTNHISDHPIYTDSKIPLCSANGVHGPQIAEWVVMMSLVHSHKLPRLYDLQKEQKWVQSEGIQVSDRVGKRVGILGYGSIGRQGEATLLRFRQCSSIELDSDARHPLHLTSWWTLPPTRARRPRSWTSPLISRTLCRLTQRDRSLFRLPRHRCDSQPPTSCNVTSAGS